MTTATYKLQHDGIAKTNDVVIDSQWWTRSPQPIESVGAGYEAMAEVLSNTGATLTGDFDVWLPLVLDRFWSAESDGDSMTEIKVQVRESSTKNVVGTANIQLENESQSVGYDDQATALANPLGPITMIRNGATVPTIVNLSSLKFIAFQFEWDFTFGQYKFWINATGDGNTRQVDWTIVELFPEGDDNIIATWLGFTYDPVSGNPSVMYGTYIENSVPDSRFMFVLQDAAPSTEAQEVDFSMRIDWP